MTQHPLQFNPNRKVNETESLSDMWSQADILLKELPKARQRKEVGRAEHKAWSTSGDSRIETEGPSHSGDYREEGDSQSRTPELPRQGLLRKK